MGTPGTKNAAIIWRLIKSNGAAMSEADVRAELGLGVGTVHRLMRTMEHQGFLSRQQVYRPHKTAGRQSVAYYSAEQTIDAVRASMCPPVSGAAKRVDVDSYFGQGLGRVSCVWELGGLAP